MVVRYLMEHKAAFFLAWALVSLATVFIAPTIMRSGCEDACGPDAIYGNRDSNIITCYNVTDNKIVQNEFKVVCTPDYGILYLPLLVWMAFLGFIGVIVIGIMLRWLG